MSNNNYRSNVNVNDDDKLYLETDMKNDGNYNEYVRYY